MLTLTAPAKINLTLEVLAKRQDGFHEIRSVIQTIGLADTLEFHLDRAVDIKSDLPEWIAEDSLVSRTVRLVQENTGCSKGVFIKVSKRIPLLSGLGGDSSNAAAVLRGLNQLWELGLPQKELLEMAWQLGSDVALFLYGGTALIEGRGELVTPLPQLPSHWIVLMIPPVPRLPGKTKQLYESLKTNHFTDGQITQQLVNEIKEGKDFPPSLLFNTFENVAFTRFSKLRVSQEHMVKAGTANVHLSGSGPALFTLVKDKHEAEELHIRLKQQDLEIYLVETLPPIE
ncbi:4-(cytidine 5'-diphospho)-2-C-methyl-D-erythritol kinase [Chloroflexota bacterium]